MRIACNPVEVCADLIAYYSGKEPSYRFARLWYWIGKAVIVDRQYLITRPRRV